MIYHAAQPITQSPVQPTEAVPHIPGTNPYQQQGIPITFRLPDKGSRADDKEQEQHPYVEKTKEKKQHIDDKTEMFQLILNKDFNELIDFFLVPGHRDIIHIRSDIKEHKALGAMRLFRPEIMNNERLDIIRHRLYLVTFEFYFTTTGKKLFLSI